MAETPVKKDLGDKAFDAFLDPIGLDDPWGAKKLGGPMAPVVYDAVKSYVQGTPFIEPPAPQEEVAQPNTLGQDRPPSGSSPMGNEVPLPSIPRQATGPSRSKSRLMGERTPGQTQQEKAQGQYDDARVQQYYAMVGTAHLNAGKAVQSVHQKFAHIAATDSAAVARLVTDEFPKFKEASKKLQEDLEDIRTLRVNPYQYLQAAGKGGRAGAVLATAVSQMAAGAGGVNNARKALKNAIDRDVESQAANIELQFAGVEASRANIASSIAILEQEILFRDKAQAYAWEAATSIINAANQGAANEATYLGTQMLGTFASIQAAAAAAALRAKQSTLYIEEPVRRAYDVLSANKLGDDGQALLEKAFNTGHASAAAGPVQEQQDLRFLAQDAPQMAPVAGGTSAAPAETKALAPSVATRRTGGGGSTPKVSTEVGEVKVGDAAMAPGDVAAFEEQHAKADMVFTEEEAGITPQAGVGEDGVPDALRPEKPQAKPNAKQLAWEFYGEQATRRPGGGKQYADEGSHAQRYFNSQNISRKARSIGEMGDEILNNESRFFGNPRGRALMRQDAEQLRAIDKKYGAPPIGSSQQALEEWKYRTEFTELYEADTSWSTGSKRVNTITSDLFGTVVLKDDEHVRGNSKRRTDINKAFADADIQVRRLREISDAMEEGTVGDILGFRYDAEEQAWEFTGMDESQMTLLAKLKQAQTAMGIQWIKSKDPAGRLSDQDIKLALSVINPASGTFMKKMDVIQTAAFGGGMSNVRRAVQAYLKVMADDVRTALEANVKSDVILTPAAWKARREGIEKDIEFFNTRYKEQGLKPPPEMEETMRAE